jgi:hypothetical protein
MYFRINYEVEKDREPNPWYLMKKNATFIRFWYEVCPRSIRLYFFPRYVMARGWGNSVVVQGTFMRMRDTFLPRNTAGSVCHCQMAKWCSTYSSYSRFAQDDRNLGIPKRKQSAKFSILSAMMQWGSLKLKSGSAAIKMAACQWTVTSILGDRQRAEMLMSLTKSFDRLGNC